MKLPSAQTTTSLPVTQRQAMTQASPAMLTSPRERFIPEQTADQIAALYRTKGQAKSNIASSMAGALNKHVVAANKHAAAAKRAQIAADDAQATLLKQDYMLLMSDWYADAVVNGATEVHVASDNSITGSEVTRPWERMDDDYVKYSDDALRGSSDGTGPQMGLLQAQGVSKGAEANFNKWRVGFDKQVLGKIQTYQTDQTIDLASTKYQEGMGKMSSIGKMTAYRDAMVLTGVDNKFAWEVWDKQVRRVYHDYIQSEVNGFAIAAGHPESKLELGDFMTMKATIMDQMGRDDSTMPLPEGARDQVHKSLMSIQERMGELIEAKHDVAYNQLIDQYQKKLLLGDVDAIEALRVAVSSEGARTKYGKNYKAVVSMLTGATQSSVNNRESDAALTKLIDNRGGRTAAGDGVIQREIAEEYAAGRLSTQAFNAKMSMLRNQKNKRKSSNFATAKGVLRTFYVGGLSDEKMEQLLNTEAGTRKQARYAAAATRLTQYFNDTNGDLDLLPFVLNQLIGNKNVVKHWMRTGSNKGIETDDPDMELMPLLARVSGAASRANLHKVAQEARDRGDDPVVIEAVLQERLEELRSLELTRIYINTFNGYIPVQDNAFDARADIENWITNPANRASILDGDT